MESRKYMLSSHIYLVRCSLLCLKINARQVQAQGHGGLGEGFTGIAGRAVKVQTQLLIKTNKTLIKRNDPSFIFGNTQHDAIQG